jgi:enamine deaminase RidA (YjgF/YER057c/UK114 family)
MPRTARNHPGYGLPVPGFSHAVLAPKGGQVLTVSGLTARDKDGNIVGVDDPEAQVRQIMSQMAAILENAGASLDDVMQLRTFTTSIEYWPAVEAVWRELWGPVWPTSTFVEISRLYDPRQLIEIEALAVIAPPKKGSE